MRPGTRLAITGLGRVRHWILLTDISPDISGAVFDFVFAHAHARPLWSGGGNGGRYAARGSNEKYKVDLRCELPLLLAMSRDNETSCLLDTQAVQTVCLHLVGISKRSPHSKRISAFQRTATAFSGHNN